MADSGGMNSLGVVAVAVTSLGGVFLAYINARITAKTAALSSDQGIRTSLQEQIKSLSDRLEAEIEHRNNCEEEKTQLRRRHDNDIAELIEIHRIERHNLKGQYRALSTKFGLLLESLDRRGIKITEEELVP